MADENESRLEIDVTITNGGSSQVNFSPTNNSETKSFLSDMQVMEIMLGSIATESRFARGSFNNLGELTSIEQTGLIADNFKIVDYAIEDRLVDPSEAAEFSTRLQGIREKIAAAQNGGYSRIQGGREGLQKDIQLLVDRAGTSALQDGTPLGVALRELASILNEPVPIGVAVNAANLLAKDAYARVRTHNQYMTVAARAIAERKTFGHLS